MDMLCGPHMAVTAGGMALMYPLMSAFHSAPWLRLASRSAKRSPPVLILCPSDASNGGFFSPLNTLKG